MNPQIKNLETFAATNLNIQPQNELPKIYVPGNGVPIRDSARSIFQHAAERKELFNFQGNVCKIVNSPGFSGKEIQLLKPSSARSEFEKYGALVKKTKGEDQPTILSENDAKAILDSDISIEVLPGLKAVLDYPIPVLRQTSFAVLTVGYNPVERYFVTGGSLQEPETVDKAVVTIKKLFKDFDFQTDSDHSRAIAFMLTPAMKLGGFLSGSTPLDIIEANESQTGKGYLANLRATLYGQPAITISQQKGGVGSLDERLGSSLLRGKPFIILDNLRGKLDSQTLESFLTNQGYFSIRTPYKGEQYISGDAYFIALTSNGIETTEDLANRSSFIRLLKDKDREFTRVNGQSISEAVASNRPLHLGAITRIIREWVESGMPTTPEKRHPFHQWAQPLDWIVQNYFELPPLLEGNEAAQERVQNPSLVFVRQLSILVEKDNMVNKPLKAKDLAELCTSSGVSIPGLEGKMDLAHEKQQFQRIGQIMVTAFANKTELTIEGFRIVKKQQKTEGTDGQTWPSQIYTFSKETSGSETPTD